MRKKYKEYWKLILNVRMVQLMKKGCLILEHIHNFLDLYEVSNRIIQK